MNDIASIIERDIEQNDNEDSYNFSEKTIAEFKTAIAILKMAEVYVQRIDWLMSGDDGEDTFHERLFEDMGKLK